MQANSNAQAIGNLNTVAAEILQQNRDFRKEQRKANEELKDSLRDLHMTNRRALERPVHEISRISTVNMHFVTATSTPNRAESATSTPNRAESNWQVLDVTYSVEETNRRGDKCTGSEAEDN